MREREGRWLVSAEGMAAVVLALAGPQRCGVGD